MGNRPWLVEPWFDATSLDSYLSQDGPQPLGDVLLRITQIAGALDFAAAAGVHHGALHPREILFSEERTRLTGIGIIEALSDAGLDVPMEGAFVSPQRALGLPPASSDDVYSLAAITYELVYGTPVPRVSDLRRAMTRLTGVAHDRFVDVLHGALSKEPDVRPGTALQFAAALQGVLVSAEAPQAVTRPEGQSAEEAERAETLGAETLGAETLRTAEEQRDAEIPIMLRDDSDPADDLPLRTTAAEITPFDVPQRTSEPAFDAIPAPIPVQAPQPVIVPYVPDVASEPTSRWLALTATLAIGLLTGFASGFVVGQRDATPVPRSAERAVPRAQRQAPPADKSAGTSGQEFTESDVPPKPVVDEPVKPPAESTQSLPASQAERRDQNVRTPSPQAVEPARPAERGPGSLEIDSRPQGARVFLDGRLVGKTPMSLPDVQPGLHAVRIDLPGHQRWVTSVNVAPASRQRVAASLER